MKLSELKQAVDILTPYYNRADGDHVSAEHDMIYLHETDQILSADDQLSMIGMGWFQEYGASEDQPFNYNPCEAWQHHT